MKKIPQIHVFVVMAAITFGALFLPVYPDQPAVNHTSPSDLVRAQMTLKALVYAQEAARQAQHALSEAQKEGGDVVSTTNALVQAQNVCTSLIRAQRALAVAQADNDEPARVLDALVSAQIAAGSNPEDKHAQAMLHALANGQQALSRAEQVQTPSQGNVEDPKPYLWVYWENKDGMQMPGFISLCRKTLRKHCSDSFKIVELDNNTIYDYLPELREREALFKVKLPSLHISQKVDYYRVLLLYKYGGMYLDADMLVMKDLKPLADKLADYDYVGFGCYDHVGFGDPQKGKGYRGYGFPDNWAMASRPGGTLISRVLRNLENKLLNDTITDYFDLGRGALWEEMRNLFLYNYRYYHAPSELDGTRDIDGNWVDPRKLFTNEQATYKDINKVLFFVLFNSAMTPEYRQMTEEQLLASDTNFAKFVKISLGLDQADKRPWSKCPM